MVVSSLPITPSPLKVSLVVSSLPITPPPLPPTVSLVVSSLPPRYVEGLLQYLSEGLQTSRHVGVYARWTHQTLHTHGIALKGRAPQLVQCINALQRALNLHDVTLNKL